jgi:glucose-1-phosphate cytidylyltransferase
MKVVLFCGGYGMRMRDGASDLPKPMTPLGERPLLWHVMRYYAHFGHTEFILCLGFGARHIKDYFLDYRETASNDFVLHGQSHSVELLARDIDDWTITFVDTGRDTAIGERLRRVAGFLTDDEMFLANYADILTDAPLDTMVEDLRNSPDAVATLLAVRPQSAFHVVDLQHGDYVTGIHQVSDLPMRENGGYFVFRRELLDHIAPGEDLVADALSRLSEQGRVKAFRHDGFWQPADTVKERALLEHMFQQGQRPWAPWDTNHQDAR